MKIKKKIRIAAVSLLGTSLLLFVILVAHIASAKQLENRTIQISRIDFDKPFDSIGAIEVKSNIQTIPGVKSDVLVKGNVLVYFHDNKVTNSQKVFDALMTKGHYNARRFTVPENIASKQVCPVMDPNSTYYKFSETVKKIFN